MPTVAEIPAGFLSLLGLKTGGDNPSEMNRELAAVIELRHQYIQSKIEHVFALFTLNVAVGTFVEQDAPTLPGELLLEVPPGEIWWIEQYSARLNPAAGITMEVFLALKEKPAQWVALSGSSGSVVNPRVALHGCFSAASPGGGFWMTPGTKLGMLLSTLVGAPGVGSTLATVRLARFRI
jgi:hypothetical protein